MNSTGQMTVSGQRYHGPHPGIVAIIYVILFMASLVLFSLLSNGASFPSPIGDTRKFQQLLHNFPAALKTNAFLQFATAIPLGIFTAAATTRIRSLGVNAAGPNIALFGGTAASLFISISSLVGWVLCQPGVADQVSIVQTLRLISFGTGGIAHVMPLGLLMAGISVPCLIRKQTPKWIAWLGLVLAVLAQLCMLGLVFPQAFVLLPIVRLGSYIWMICIGFALMKTKSKALAKR